MTAGVGTLGLNACIIIASIRITHLRLDSSPVCLLLRLRPRMGHSRRRELDQRHRRLCQPSLPRPGRVRPVLRLGDFAREDRNAGRRRRRRRRRAVVDNVHLLQRFRRGQRNGNECASRGQVRGRKRTNEQTNKQTNKRTREW